MAGLEEDYYALMGGQKFEAAMTIDPDIVDLYWEGADAPVDGFEPDAPGFLIRHTPINELDGVYRTAWFCEYRGEPFKVSDERGDKLLLYYLGGSEEKAREIGLEIQEPLVAVGLIPRNQVENLREVETRIWPEGGETA